jgi:hypothetical protein
MVTVQEFVLKPLTSNSFPVIIKRT